MQVGLFDEAIETGVDEAAFWANFFQGDYAQAVMRLDKHFAAADTSSSAWWSLGQRLMFRSQGGDVTSPEFADMVNKEVGRLEQRGVPWREQCNMYLVHDLRAIGADESANKMMAQCHKQFEERLKVNYICPCSYFGLIVYTALDGRYDEAMRRADQWLESGDSEIFLPMVPMFEPIRETGTFREILARNDAQLAKQQQMYLAGRSATAGQ
jgi:hypothetical protein